MKLPPIYLAAAIATTPLVCDVPSTTQEPSAPSSAGWTIGRRWSPAESSTRKGTTAVVDVKDFGATGDGTTNDTAAFQAAVNAAAGKTLLAEGTFNIASVRLIGNVTYDFRTATFIKGATRADGMFDLNGISDVVILGGRYTSDASSATFTDAVGRTWIQGSAFYVHGGCSHLKFDGGAFEGTVAGWYAGASGWFTGFSVYDSSHVEIINTRHVNGNAGINVVAIGQNVWGVKVNHNTILGGGDDGITFMTRNSRVARAVYNSEAIGNLLDKTGMDTTQVAGVGLRVARDNVSDIGSISHMVIASNTFRNMNVEAIYVNHTTDSAITGNTVNGFALKTSSGGAAFVLGDGSTSAVARLTVTGNTISGGVTTSYKGIAAQGLSDSTIAGNTVLGNAAGFGAIDLHWSSHNLVTGNRVTNAHATSVGIQTNDYSDHNTITANDVTGSGSWGVYTTGANDVAYANVGATRGSAFGAGGGISPSKDDLSGQTGRVFQGGGAPDNANGSDGDFYFRTDAPGAMNQRIYVKAAGSWRGIL